MVEAGMMLLGAMMMELRDWSFVVVESGD